MKVYVSSTYRDLREHRAAVDRALRRMGHDVIGMEQYVAEGGRPLQRCLADVRLADVYVLILAWRYGYVPTTDNPEALSITELEYRQAVANGKPILGFMLAPDAPWPPSEMDAMLSEAPAADINRFRADVGSSHVLGVFHTADDLASQVAAAVVAQGATTGLIDRLLADTSVTAADMGGFGAGGEVSDASLRAVKDMVVQAGSRRAIIVNLGEGDDWWSTRLYLLASLVRTLTPVRQLVFRRGDGAFVGMASPSAVADGLAAQFPILAELAVRVSTDASLDLHREIDRQFDEWTALLTPPRGGGKSQRPGPRLAGRGTGLPGEITGAALDAERELKVSVRADLLDRWLDDRLISRCIRVDGDGPSMVQIQQIVESVLPDVPIEREIGDGDDCELMLQVVDRDAFALELARQWVRSGLPRTPVR
jgi:hypothetical protein